MSEQILYIVLGLISGGAVVWFFLRKNAPRPEQDNTAQRLEAQINSLQHLMGQQLNQFTQHVSQNMDQHKNFIANRVSAAERSVRSVSEGLGKLEQATAMLQKTSTEIASFQQMLRSPKVRGSFGEVLLGNLLHEVLPQDRFELQYLFRSTGEIADSIIRLQDSHIVAVDAKFPLAGYETYMNEKDTERKASWRKVFMREVKKHITDISKKYISPQEHTLDFAFMYIPVEGVYYETMVHSREGESLWEFCLSSHVIPVSPNSFLAYLQTVLVGLRGMRIEQQAREILQHLGQLRNDFGKFSDEFSTVGSHLNNAKNKYDSSLRRLDKFTNRLDQIESHSEPEKLPEAKQPIPERIPE